MHGYRTWIRVDTTYFDIRVELNELANKINSGYIGDTDKSSRCLTKSFHHRRTIACIALLVHLDPLLNIA